MHDFTRLEIWKTAVRLAKKLSGAIPVSSGRVAPGFRAQALRAAQRIADAIAEGCGKGSDYELARFADIAGGSVSEVQSQLAFARIHRIIARDVFRALWAEYGILRRRINAFHRVVRRRAEENDVRNRRKRGRDEPETPTD